MSLRPGGWARRSHDAGRVGRTTGAASIEPRTKNEDASVMMIDLNPPAEAAGAVPATFSYDPTAPVPPPAIGRIGLVTAPSRQNQRRRRAMILATIRQLIIEEGGDGVTVR